MNENFIIDKNGRKIAVQVPMKDWEHIKKNLEELDRLKDKKVFMVELAEAVEEMKLIMKGKKQAHNAQDFIDEL
jgi:hypothetical protein